LFKDAAPEGKEMVIEDVDERAGLYPIQVMYV